MGVAPGVASGRATGVPKPGGHGRRRPGKRDPVGAYGWPGGIDALGQLAEGQLSGCGEFPEWRGSLLREVSSLG